MVIAHLRGKIAEVEENQEEEEEYFVDPLLVLKDNWSV